MPGYEVITVEELKALIDSGAKCRIIDVREPSEFRIAKIEGAELKPLGEIMRWMQELEEKDEEIILMCHHGMRSDRACQFLAAHGFSRVFNLRGGIDSWSASVDPGVPRY